MGTNQKPFLNKHRWLSQVCVWVLLSLGMASLVYAQSQRKDLYAKQSSVWIQKAKFEVALWPAKHQLDVTALFSLAGPQIPKRLRMYLPQLIQLKDVALQGNKGWTKVKHERQLETVVINLGRVLKRKAKVRLRYTVVFDSSKNYLFRGIFCQIKPGESYFLYGWYPSLRPFADPLSGQLLRGHRWHYQLELEVPAKERPVAAGPLLKSWKVKNGRKRFLFGSSPIKEAAIFFVSAHFKIYRYRYPDRHVEFFLHRYDSRRAINALVRMTSKVQRFYTKLWGDPRGSKAYVQQGRRRRIKPVVWRLISFGGSGARGYPFTLLLDRREDFFGGSLKRSIDRLFSKRQVLLHEMAHTWWGNAVTGVGKGSIWLNEGLANYASIRALGGLYGKKAETASIQRHIAYFLDGAGSGRLLEPGGLAQMAQRTAYTKGALVFVALERRFSREVVDQGLRYFFQEYRGKYPEIKDLKKSLEKATGRSLDGFFRDWIHGGGLPYIEMNQSYRKRIKRRQYQLQLTLENRGTIEGVAHVRVWDYRKSHDLWIPVPPGKARKFIWKHKRRIKRVQFNPDGVMLHGFRWRAILQQANQLRRAGNSVQASVLFRRLLQAFPSHGHALYSWALLNQKQKRFAQARKLFQKAGQCKPSQRTPRWVPLWAKFRYASLLLKQGNADEKKKATQALKRLLLSPTNPYRLHQRIQALLGTKK